MKKATFFTLAAATLLAGSSAAKAAIADPAAVTPGDTFSFDISGFNSAGTIGYLLTPDETATFGATTTFAAAGINGQDITITSGETVNGLTTTDTFTVSTPTSFITTAKVSGTTIAAVQFDIGNANAGGNTVSYSLPVTGYSNTGNVIYGASNTSFTLTSTPVLTNGAESLAVAEGVNFGAAASTAAPHSFTFSITYNTIPTAVPEPSTYAAAGVGALALGTVLLRRKRQ